MKFLFYWRYSYNKAVLQEKYLSHDSPDRKKPAFTIIKIAFASNLVSSLHKNIRYKLV